ncbi:MAG TPA: hypothetical protein VLM89_01135, partial [Phycisphaerae bacterium]|nr:hypothetical protein [Phycisphaerae bacterium]
MSTHRRSGQGLALLACLALTLPLLVGQGCPPGVVAGGAPTTVVRFPNLDRSAAIGETLTIVYDAVGATSVRAFYDRDKTINTGDEVVFSGNLPAGSNQVAQMATASLPAGTYYLGITASNSAGTSSAYGAGKITLVASAQVKFLSPAQDMRVGAGVSVPIRFDAGVTAFDYRVFIDGDSTANGNETTIATGSSSGSSAVQVPFDTSPRPAGTYYVGCTVTTPAGASRTAYASHTITVTTGAYVQLLAPTFGLAVSPGDFVQVVVAANDPQDPAAQVRVFHDTDNQFGNGNEVDIAILPQISTGTVWDTTGVGPGFYYVGAELQNGLTPPLVSYSPGPLEVLGQGGGIGGGGTLTVTTPTSAVTVLEGAVYRIGWTVNLARGEGVVRIF